MLIISTVSFSHCVTAGLEVIFFGEGKNQFCSSDFYHVKLDHATCTRLYTLY